jgi:putative FmdB family regulatory protein
MTAKFVRSPGSALARDPLFRLKTPMPTYDYVCDACEHKFELFQSMKDEPEKKCPKCKKKKLRRLFGAGAGIIFKGSGFYTTDYRSDSYKKRAEADKSSSSSSDSGGSSSKESSGSKDSGSSSSSAKDSGSSSSGAKSESSGGGSDKGSKAKS